MPSQLLVNVLRVPAGSAVLAPGASVTVNPGLFSDEKAVVPTLIQPDRGTGIVVDETQPITATSVTFKNNGGVDAFAFFRFERGLEIEVVPGTLTTSYWQGTAAGGGGNINAVTASAPLNSSNPGGPVTDISLDASGVVPATYGVVAGPTESIMPVFTVDTYGRITSATSGAIRINGDPAKTYVDLQDAATLAAAEAYAESLAFGIASKAPAHVATTVALTGYTATTQILTANSNIAFPQIDGQTVVLGERVLVKNQTAGEAKDNGIYVLADTGAPNPGGRPWILTRAADANTDQEICGALVTVETGLTNAGTVWIFSANPATFDIGVDPINWQPISIQNATTLVPGAVQLAGGLGGAGSVYIDPKLNVDAINVTGGTLPAVRGGTGLSAVGASGNVLTSDGSNWTSSPLPSFITSVAIDRTLYVESTGGTLPTATGSLTAPFNNLQDAITQATTLYGASTPVAIVVSPGSYVGNITVNRKNLFFQGAGARPEDNQATQIVGTVTLNLSGVGSVYNDQVSFDGFFITGGAGRAAYITGTTQFSPTFTNCYLAAGSTGGLATLQQDNNNARLTLVDCTLAAPTAGGGPAFSLSGLTRASNMQVISGAGAATSLITGNGVGFFDRIQWSYAGAGYAVTVNSSVSPATAPWFASSGAAYFTLVNSSITSSASGCVTVSTALPAAGSLVTTFLANNAFFAATTAINVSGVQAYIAYANTFLPTSNTVISGGTAVASLESHTDMRLEPLTASRPLKVNASKVVTADKIDLGSANDVTGNVAVANGGTGASSLAGYGVLLMNVSGSAVTSLVPGGASTSGQLLRWDGTQWNASWSAGKQDNSFTLSGYDVGSVNPVTPVAGFSILPRDPVVRLNNAGAVTPGGSPGTPQINTSLQAGTRLTVMQIGAGTTTFWDAAQPGYSWSGVHLGGVASRTLSQYQAIDFVFDGTYWIERAVGGGGGTVTSVDVSGGTTGLTTSGGPIIGAGTITLAGTLGATNGGTAQSTYATGDLLYASAANTLSKRTIGTAGQVLTVTGGVPTWETPSVPSGALTGITAGTGISVTGSAPSPTVALSTPVAVANGGTGAATATANLVFAGPTTGPAAAPSFRSLVTADLPANSIPYDVGGSAAAVPVSTSLFLFVATRAFTLGATNTDYRFRALTPAAATSTLLTLEHVDPAGPTTTPIGTVTFPGDNTTVAPVFNLTAPSHSVAAGTYLRLYSGASVDSSLADVMFTFPAVRNAV